jgi:hypothetical protein
MSETRTGDPERASSWRCDRVLRRGVGAEAGAGDPAADRSHVHDPAPSGGEERERGPGERHDGEEVHVEHRAPVLLGQVLEGTADPDPGVVHQTLQARGPHRGLDLGERARDLLGVAHVEDHGADVARARGDPLAVGRLADAGEDGPAPLGEARRARLTDPGRRAGDERVRHGRLPVPAGRRSGRRRGSGA